MHMSDYRKDDRHKMQLVRLALYISIAVISILYTKTVHTDKETQSRTAAGNTEESDENDKIGIGGGSMSIDSGENGVSPDTDEVNRVLTIPFINQNDYPTGCESVTSVMALNYAGCDITVDEFIDEHLKIGKYYWKDGQYYGNSPYDYFIGNPRGDGFGCFAPVIHEALEGAVGEKRVKDLTGMTLQQICREYIANGIPVIIWATIGMQPSYEGRSWTILETGKEYTWPAEEHCLLLVGTDNAHYYFNDPKEETGGTAYGKAVAEERYQEMGRQALAVLPEN